MTDFIVGFDDGRYVGFVFVGAKKGTADDFIVGPAVKGSDIDGREAGDELIGFFVKGLTDDIVGRFAKINDG